MVLNYILPVDGLADDVIISTGSVAAALPPVAAALPLVDPSKPMDNLG